MSQPALETALRRDRAIVLAALVALAGLAWAYVLWLAHDMAIPMDTMMAPAARAWSAADFGFTFAMWAVMMAGMMTPSAAAMILLYARVARQAQTQGHVFASTGWFAAGYLLAWTAFAALGALAQGALLDAALISPMLAGASRIFGGAVLIAAGLYQWMPLKDACLAQCRAPLDFIMRHGGFKPQAHRALMLGVRHGLYCIGCCWALMALLFVGGVMNVLWIAGIAIFVLIEKVFPAGRIVGRIAGAVLIAAGIWLVISPTFRH